MAMDNYLSAVGQYTVNPFANLGSKNPSTVSAGHQGRVEQPQISYASDPRGSLFDGFDVSGWSGSPVYGEGERTLDYNA